MTAKNEHTGDLIASKQPTDAYRKNWDAIFGQKTKTPQKPIPKPYQHDVKRKTGDW